MSSIPARPFYKEIQDEHGKTTLEKSQLKEDKSIYNVFDENDLTKETFKLRNLGSSPLIITLYRTKIVSVFE